MALEMRFGTVTQVSPVLKVKVGHSTVGIECKKGRAYTTPAINDWVYVFIQGGDRVVGDAIG